MHASFGVTSRNNTFCHGEIPLLIVKILSQMAFATGHERRDEGRAVGGVTKTSSRWACSVLKYLQWELMCIFAMAIFLWRIEFGKVNHNHLLLAFPVPKKHHLFL